MQPVGARHLEIADDVVVEGTVAGEIFQQVERDVRLPFLVHLADRRQIIVDADHLHLMAEIQQRGLDVVLGAVFLHPRVVLVAQVIRRHQRVGHQHHDTQFFHMARREVPLRREPM